MPRVKKTANQKSKIKNQKSKLQLKSKKLMVKTKSISRGLTIDLFDPKGRIVGVIDLPKEIFGAKVNNQLLAQAVRVYLANQRKGTVSTKTRGEVSGSTRKIWRQKGTGRARHGSRKAPIFVGGGVVFGPKPRDFKLKLSKKMKKLSLSSALSAKHKAHEIKAVAGLEKLAPKTKLMVKVIENLGIDKKNMDIFMIIPGKSMNVMPTKSDFVTSPESVEKFENVYRAARNIEGIRIVSADTLNAYDVLNNKLILLMDKAINSIKERFWKEKDSN